MMQFDITPLSIWCLGTILVSPLIKSDLKRHRGPVAGEPRLCMVSYLRNSL